MLFKPVCRIRVRFSRKAIGADALIDRPMADAAVARLCRDLLVKLMTVFGGRVTHPTAADADQMAVQLDRQVKAVCPGDLNVIYLAVLREQREISVHRPAADMLIAGVYALVYLLCGRVVAP